VIIKLTVEGQVYEFDGDRLLLAEARELKTFTGLTPPKWSAGITEGDPDAIQFLVYLAKKRSGEAVRFSDLNSIDYADIDMEILGEDAEEPAEGGQPPAGADPTPPSNGTTQTDGIGATSPPSPTDSSTTLRTSAV